MTVVGGSAGLGAWGTQGRGKCWAKSLDKICCFQACTEPKDSYRCHPSNLLQHPQSRCCPRHCLPFPPNAAVHHQRKGLHVLRGGGGPVPGVQQPRAIEVCLFHGPLRGRDHPFKDRIQPLEQLHGQCDGGMEQLPEGRSFLGRQNVKGDHEDPPGPQHTVHLADEGHGLGHVLQYTHAVDHVRAAGRGRQRALQVGELEGECRPLHLGHVLQNSLERGVVVQAMQPHGRDAARQRPHEEVHPATQIEHGAVVREEAVNGREVEHVLVLAGPVEQGRVLGHPKAAEMPHDPCVVGPVVVVVELLEESGGRGAPGGIAMLFGDHAPGPQGQGPLRQHVYGWGGRGCGLGPAADGPPDPCGQQHKKPQHFVRP
mmetsp:Transcript_65685/g.110281  ORF Transcript_65685/g.110281 Transcript_65685/m.110281 type:complete len:371 (+) Transcript_65685:132-1244(+)